MKTIELGSVRIHRVAELAPMPVDAGLIFANATPELFARGRQWLDARFIHPTEDRIYIAFHSFVIQTGSRTILVDTCNGNHKTRRAPVDYAANLNVDYLGNLTRAGFRPEDIDLVLCTHLHFDHIGWNTRLRDGRWAPTFPNAKYLMSPTDYEHFERQSAVPGSMEAEAFQDSILSVVATRQVELIDAGYTIEHELGHSVRIEGMPGHTPGSVVLHATTKAGSAIFSGDVMHHALQIIDTTLSPHVDWDMAMAARTRRRLLESCADWDTLLLTAHFPDPTAGRVVSGADGFRFEFVG